MHGGGGGEGEPLALRVAAIRGVCRGRGAEAHRCRGAEAHLSDRQDLLCCHTAADVDAVVVPGRTVEPRASLRAPPLATHGDRPLVRVRQPPKPLGASDGGEEGGPQRQGCGEGGELQQHAQVLRERGAVPGEAEQRLECTGAQLVEYWGRVTRR